MDAKKEHLVLIQNVVTRMAGNSFLIKGWSVTLVSGLFALLAAKDADKNYLFVAIVPIVVFWILDAYYLHQERQFRGLYEVVRLKPPDLVDFSMTPVATKSAWPLLNTLLVMFYGTLLLSIFLVRYFL